MRARSGFNGLLLAAALLAAAAMGQEPELVRVEVRVSAVLGRAAYVDGGSQLGLALGDTVRFLTPAGAGAPVEQGSVGALSSSSARVDLDLEPLHVVPGSVGECFVPAARPAPQAADGGTLPERPLWSDAPQEWSADMPLLAGYEEGSSSRPTSLSGRTWWRGFYTRDESNGSRSYSSLRLGTQFSLENPLDHPGQLEANLEFSQRAADSDDEGQDESSSRLRIERLSYAVGGTRERQRRLEFGRFVSQDFPEFGVLDGVDFTWRSPGGQRLGASVGALPEPTDSMSTGKDLSAAAYWVGSFGEARPALALGYQKTWHDGSADRDLVVARARWSPDPRTTLSGGFWLDLYDSTDTLAEGSSELTQANLRLSRRLGRASGLALFASQQSFPLLRRFEFPLPSDAELVGDRVTRTGVDGWTDLGDQVRLSAHVQRWSDEDAQGGSGELRLAFPDLFWSGEVSLAGFGTRQEGSEAVGVRLGTLWNVGRGGLRFDLELANQEFLRRFGEHAQLYQGALRSSWDLLIGEAWRLALYSDLRLGDQLDAQTFGFHLTRSF